MPGYDYSLAGAYAITICVKDRECALGSIRDHRFIGNDLARIVNACWIDLPAHYDGIALDAFVIMPNHVHGIVLIDDARQLS
ncbi:MAG: transposase, partial [Candidatus Zixiibacteriota bacterium]